jgi:hypothetical protein
MLAPFLQALAKLDERQVALVRETEKPTTAAHREHARHPLRSGPVAAAFCGPGAGCGWCVSITRPLARAVTSPRRWPRAT